MLFGVHAEVLSILYVFLDQFFLENEYHLVDSCSATSILALSLVVRDCY